MKLNNLNDYKEILRDYREMTNQCYMLKDIINDTSEELVKDIKPKSGMTTDNIDKLKEEYLDLSFFKDITKDLIECSFCGKIPNPNSEGNFIFRSFVDIKFNITSYCMNCLNTKNKVNFWLLITRYKSIPDIKKYKKMDKRTKKARYFKKNYKVSPEFYYDKTIGYIIPIIPFCITEL